MVRALQPADTACNDTFSHSRTSLEIIGCGKGSQSESGDRMPRSSMDADLLPLRALAATAGTTPCPAPLPCAFVDGCRPTQSGYQDAPTAGPRGLYQPAAALRPHNPYAPGNCTHADATGPSACSEPGAESQVTPPAAPDVRVQGATAKVGSRAPRRNPTGALASESSLPPQPSAAQQQLAACPALPALPIQRGAESSTIVTPDALAALRARRQSLQDGSQVNARSNASLASQTYDHASLPSPPQLQQQRSRKQEGVPSLPPAICAARPAASSLELPRNVTVTECLPALASGCAGSDGPAASGPSVVPVSPLRLPSLPLATPGTEDGSAAILPVAAMGPPAARSRCGWASSRRIDPFALTAVAAQASGGAAA